MFSSPPILQSFLLGVPWISPVCYFQEFVFNEPQASLIFFRVFLPFSFARDVLPTLLTEHVTQLNALF